MENSSETSVEDCGSTINNESLSDTLEPRKYASSAEYKSTCEACHNSKVRCSGNRNSCDRCLKTKRECVYLKRKPRQRASSNVYHNFSIPRDQIKNLYDLTITAVRHEKGIPILPRFKKELFFSEEIPSRNELAWRLFELLLESHGGKESGAVHYDLVTHLRGCKAHLVSLGLFKDALRLDALCQEHLEKDLDVYFFKMSKFILERIEGGMSYDDAVLTNFHEYKAIIAKAINPSATIEFNPLGSPLLYALSESIQQSTPMILFKIDSENLKLNIPTRIQVFPNVRFRLLFGLSTEEITQRLSTSVAGFLPYGLSVFSLIVSSKNDLCTLLETMCIKTFSNIPKNAPVMFEFPSTDILHFNVLANAVTRETKEIECTVLTIVRSLRDTNTLHEEIYIKIDPHEPIDYLWSDLKLPEYSPR